MARGWRKQQSNDRFFRRAQAEGYRARSAYKLQQLNERFALLRPGQQVLDLGAAPGSWSQVASAIVGETGKVVAVDLQPMEPLPGVVTIQGDIGSEAARLQIAEQLPNGAHAVISDVAPATSGVALVDQARSLALAELSLQLALQLLRPGGSFVVKVFQGGDFNSFVGTVRARFRRAHFFTPEATRRESSERYVVGLDLLRQ